MVAAPPGLAVAREPEGVVAGLAARPHAAAHVPAHAAVCQINRDTQPCIQRRVRGKQPIDSKQASTIRAPELNGAIVVEAS